jgi:hypothetical protein
MPEIMLFNAIGKPPFNSWFHKIGIQQEADLHRCYTSLPCAGLPVTLGVL